MVHSITCMLNTSPRIRSGQSSMEKRLTAQEPIFTLFSNRRCNKFSQPSTLPQTNWLMIGMTSSKWKLLSNWSLQRLTSLIHASRWIQCSGITFWKKHSSKTFSRLWRVHKRLHVSRWSKKRRSLVFRNASRLISWRWNMKSLNRSSAQLMNSAPTSSKSSKK